MFTKKIWTRVAIAVVVIVLMIFMYRKFMKKSDYVIPPTTASDTNSTRQTNYSSNLVSCETVYINSMNSAGTDAALQAAAVSTLDYCIRSNVMSYYTARCPWMGASSGAITGTNILNGTSNVSYVAYKADVDAINAVYTPLIAAANQVYSVNVMQEARKADFTGATRKYLAALCPDIYSNAVSSNLTEVYSSWTSSPVTNTFYGFQSSRVTTSNIWQWAIHAGERPNPVVTDTTYPYPTPGNPLLASPILASGTSCGNSDYASSTGGILNWQIAQENGPGTINKLVTFPWATSSTTICSAGSAALIPTATAASPLP